MNYPHPWMNWLVSGLRIVTYGALLSLASYVMFGLKVLRIPEGFAAMEPAFHGGQGLLVRAYLPITRIERGDVVVFQSAGGTLIGRVAGLPGERMVSTGGMEPTGNEAPPDARTSLIPEGMFLVLPDAPGQLEAAAAPAWGLVHKEAIKGLVLMQF